MATLQPVARTRTDPNILPLAQLLFQGTAALKAKGCTEFSYRESVVELDAPIGGRRLFDEAVSAFTADSDNTPKIIIHCVRHAQGPHNVLYGNKEPCDLKDPGLTDLGVLQCATLCKTFPRMDKITHIISSPSRRAILTTKLSFRPLINRGVPLVLLNFLKERSQCPTNEGSPIEELQKEFGDLKIVYDHLERGWETDFMDYDQHGWRPITVEMRREIFMVGMEAMKKGQVNTEGNVEMLVTSHGGTLRYFDGAKKKHDGYHWNNTEHRAYEFFSEERAQKREISRWQGLRQCLSKNFNTSAIEQPLLVKELEDWGWKIAEIERINIFRNRSLLGYQKLRADRRKIKE